MRNSVTLKTFTHPVTLSERGRERKRRNLLFSSTKSLALLLFKLSYCINLRNGNFAAAAKWAANFSSVIRVWESAIAVLTNTHSDTTHTYSSSLRIFSSSPPLKVTEADERHFSWAVESAFTLAQGLCDCLSPYSMTGWVLESHRSSMTLPADSLASLLRANSCPLLVICKVTVNTIQVTVWVNS